MTDQNQMTSQIIQDLILQDLKQHRFFIHLEQVGLTSECWLEICHPVARLMGIPFGEITDAWMTVYIHYMEQASGYEPGDGDGLRKLAERCYKELLYIR